jgi:hypothetical protein
VGRFPGVLKSFFLRELLSILTLGIGDCNISFPGVSIQRGRSYGTI